MQEGFNLSCDEVQDTQNKGMVWNCAYIQQTQKLHVSCLMSKPVLAYILTSHKLHPWPCPTEQYEMVKILCIFASKLREMQREKKTNKHLLNIICNYVSTNHVWAGGKDLLKLFQFYIGIRKLFVFVLLQ